MINKDSFFIVNVIQRVRRELPRYVWKSVQRLSPLFLISSVFELFSLALFLPLINALLNPASIHTNSILNELSLFFAFNNDQLFLLVLFSALTLLFFLKNGLIFIIMKYQSRVSYDLASKLSIEKYKEYMNESYTFHNQSNSSILLRNITQLPFELVTYLIIPITSIINEVFMLLCITVLITLYDPLLFFSLMLLTIPLYLIYNVLMKKRLKELSVQRNEQSAYLFRSGAQSMQAYREAVIHTKKPFFLSQFATNVIDYGKTFGRLTLLNAFSSKIVETVAVVGIFTIFLMGYVLDKNLIQIANFLVVFALAAFRLIPSMNKLILSNNYIKSSMYVLDYFQDLTPSTSREETPTQPERLNFTNEFRLENISFSHHAEKSPTLNGISLTVKKGETIGIVGPSGSGKTTLIDVLLKLYPHEGKLYVDKTVIDSTNLNAYYQLISYVPQNIVLIDASLLANVAFGIPTEYIDYEKVERVIEQAQLSTLIAELDEGMETRVGENGMLLSGGQRQRIGIARALYHGGEILIFDEATSALDNETEFQLTEAIQQLAEQNLTVIIVAHRLETLKYCNQLYQLENGNLIPTSLTKS